MKLDSDLQDAMAKNAQRFLFSALEPTPTNIIADGILEEIGWPSLDNFDNLAPDYKEKKEVREWALKDAVDTLIEMVKTGYLPPSAQYHVDELARMYMELVGVSAGSTGAQSQINCMVGHLNSEPVYSVSPMPKTRTRIMGDAIAAVFRDYKNLTQSQYEALYDKLEEVSDDLIDSLEGLTDAEKSTTLEKEIREWFEVTHHF